MPRRISSTLALALLLAAWGPSVMAANNYPIVLVHGFLGFGPEQYERTGFKYWGGFDDIAGHMRSYNGSHQILVTSVASIGSSWDRSAELYYQIKGGCVDYGMVHTASAPHSGERRPPGKCWAADPSNNPDNYPLALYPAWDADHPIHLFGHSQGGQTIRALIELLEQGSPHGDEGGGELYQGGKIGWVVSATTIAAPHNGTTLHDTLGGAAFKELAQGRKPATMPGRAPPWNQDQFDSAQYEMAPDGAAIFNGWVKTSPNVYYFSIANRATEAGTPCCNQTDRAIAPLQRRKYQYPRQDMAPLSKPYAGEWIVPSAWRRAMGSYTQCAPGRVVIDARWFVNDGVVNTVSMRAPSGQPVRDYDGVALIGTWNFLRTYHGYDHFDVLGWPRKRAIAYPIYEQVMDIVLGL